MIRFYQDKATGTSRNTQFCYSVATAPSFPYIKRCRGCQTKLAHVEDNQRKGVEIKCPNCNKMNYF